MATWDEIGSPADTEAPAASPDITTHVDALIKHESGGDPNAVGDGGLALGLGQMHPEVRSAYGVTPNSTPDEQRKAVESYFTDLYKKHNGNIDDALSEYHLGAPNYAKNRNSPDNLKYLEEHHKHVTSAGSWDSVGVPVDTSVPQPTEQPQTVEQPAADATTTVTSTPEQAAAQKEGQPIPQTPAKPMRDYTIEEAGDEINKTYGMPPGHWTGRYTAALGKPAVDALSGLYDAIRNGGDLSQPEGVDTMLKALPVLIPATIPASAVGNVAEEAAKDAGAHPAIAKAIGFATSIIAGAKMTPTGEFRPSTGEMPLKGTTATRQAATETAAAAEQAAGRATTATEAATAAETAAAPSTEATTEAKAALAPASVTPRQGGQAVTAGLEQRLQEWKEPTQGIYNAYVAKYAKKIIDPEDSQTLLEQYDKLNDANRLTGEAGRTIKNIASKIEMQEPITVNDANEYKMALDEVLPGGPPPGSSMADRALYDFKFKTREVLRNSATGDEKSWLEAADNVWRDVIIGKGKPRALGPLVKLVKKDPETAVERLFGTGASDIQGEMAEAVMKELGDHPAAEALRQATFNRMIRKATDAEGNMDPKALSKAYDNTNELFRNAMTNDGADTFFKTLRQRQATASQTAEAAKAATAEAKTTASAAEAAAQKAQKPNMLANMTAKGLEVIAGEAAATAFGHPGLGPIFMARFLFPADRLAAYLANNKTANLLARALKTPANSAVVPVLMQKIKSATEEKPKKAA